MRSGRFGWVGRNVKSDSNLQAPARRPRANCTTARGGASAPASPAGGAFRTAWGGISTLRHWQHATLRDADPRRRGLTRWLVQTGCRAAAGPSLTFLDKDRRPAARPCAMAGASADWLQSRHSARNWRRESPSPSTPAPAAGPECALHRHRPTSPSRTCFALRHRQGAGVPCAPAPILSSGQSGFSISGQ